MLLKNLSILVPAAVLDYKQPHVSLTMTGGFNRNSSLHYSFSMLPLAAVLRHLQSDCFAAPNESAPVQK